MGDQIWLVDAGQFVRGLIPGRKTSEGRTLPHWGLDVSAVLGTPARAVRSGKVISVRAILGYGIAVFIYHNDNLSTIYAHLKSASVIKGQDVAPRDVVGLIGKTTAGPDGIVPSYGRKMGVHLHWEVHPRASPDLRMNVMRLDPVAWLRSNGVNMIRQN